MDRQKQWSSWWLVVGEMHKERVKRRKRREILSLELERAFFRAQAQVTLFTAFKQLRREESIGTESSGPNRY